MSAPIPAGRADTPAAKQELLARLLAAWERAPEQRLGQLLENAMTQERLVDGGERVDLFGVEDEPVVAMVERFAASAGARDPADPEGRTCTGAATHRGDHTAGAARWVR